MSTPPPLREVSPDKAVPYQPYLLVMAVLILVETVSAFESAMATIMFPRLMTVFNADLADVAWTATSFTLVAASSAALCGRLGDLYGRKRLLQISLALSVVGSIISFLAPSLIWVIVGRGIQGFAGAILPLVLGYVRELMPAKRAPVAIAVIAATPIISAAIGTLISGVLIDFAEWHYVFAVTGGLGLAAMASLALIRNRPRPDVAKVSRIDILGGVIFAPAIALILLGVTQMRPWGIDDPRALGMVAAGLIILGGWVWWELKIPEPMINLRLLKNRNLGLTMLAAVAFYVVPLTAMTVITPTILQSPTTNPVGLGVSPSMTGVIMFAMAIGGFLISPFAGALSLKRGPRVTMVIGGMAKAIIAVALIWAVKDLGWFILCLVITNILGTSFILTSQANMVAENVPERNASEAMGMMHTVRMIFMGVGTVIVSLVLSISVLPGTKIPTHTAYVACFILTTIACVIGVILAERARARGRAT